jgi:hypothetical protein
LRLVAHTSSQSTATPLILDYIAVGPWFEYVIEVASICASRCRKARTSLFSVTMLQIIHIPIPPAIGNHSRPFPRATSTISFAHLPVPYWDVPVPMTSPLCSVFYASMLPVVQVVLRRAVG